MKKIILHLKQNSNRFCDVEKFSDLPGIYALFFIGSEFLLPEINLEKNDIIYIGKTEKSQKARDADTHFKTGKTGNSTIRKTIGSLMAEKYSLTPIPRNNNDYSKGRKSHFKFQDLCETKITSWMIENIGLSFYEFSDGPEKLDELETKLINELSPVFNIDHKNLTNPYRKYILKERKRCAIIAQNGIFFTRVKSNISLSKVLNNPLDKVDKGKYLKLWDNVINEIIVKGNVNHNVNVQLSGKSFAEVGKRKSYSFKLELNNGHIVNNISGSAVARDLYKTLMKTDYKNIFNRGNIILLLNNDFQFKII